MLPVDVEIRFGGLGCMLPGRGCVRPAALETVGVRMRLRKSEKMSPVGRSSGSVNSGMGQLLVLRPVVRLLRGLLEVLRPEVRCLLVAIRPALPSRRGDARPLL